jgi:hypothetical protein
VHRCLGPNTRIVPQHKVLPSLAGVLEAVCSSWLENSLVRVRPRCITHILICLQAVACLVLRRARGSGSWLCLLVGQAGVPGLTGASRHLRAAVLKGGCQRCGRCGGAIRREGQAQGCEMKDCELPSPRSGKAHKSKHECMRPQTPSLSACLTGLQW